MSADLSDPETQPDPQEGTREEFVDMLEGGRIRPFYQPIVDLSTGEIYGFEILSRGAPPFEMPHVMFLKAEEWGLTWDLEYACRMAALNNFSALSEECKKKNFFMNVSPHIFSDQRFYSVFSSSDLERVGLDRRRLVIEITEATSVTDYDYFEEMISHYVKQGLRIALDDFGAGHSGLITLVAMTPHFLKLDRGLISEIHGSYYKQDLVKSMISFAANVETSLIAEGVETEEELETLLRLGIRYAQGFLFSRPKPDPAPLTDEVRSTMVRVVRKFRHPQIQYDTNISSMVQRPITVDSRTKTCEEVEYLFRSNPGLGHLLIVSGKRPLGLVTRQNFYAISGGRFGFSVFQRKHIDRLAKMDALTVGENTGIAALGRLALSRQREDIYDPVIVVDREGSLIGSITMKQLLIKAIDLEVKMAASANPLTNLPGNVMIQNRMKEALRDPPFTVVNADLDHFKEYNDTYGFSQGDEIIKLTSDNLSPIPHVGQFGQLAASLKKKIKSQNEESRSSGYLIDRRRPYSGDSACRVESADRGSGGVLRSRARTTPNICR